VKEKSKRDGIRKKTILLLADRVQALQVPNLHWRPSMVGTQTSYIMVAPEYKQDLLYIQVLAPLETVYAIL
jgi:hypothetical protein